MATHHERLGGVCVGGLPPSRSADAFARKDWYDIRTPSYFEVRTAGKTPVNRTQGTSTCPPVMGRRGLPAWVTRLRRTQRSRLTR